MTLSADTIAIVLGALVGGAAMLALRLGWPRFLADRLAFGPVLAEVRFERRLNEARKPFVEAARAGDDSIGEKARWRDLMTERPPTAAWSSIADQLARRDLAWADAARSGAPGGAWLQWQARNDEVGTAWATLRAPLLDRGRRMSATLRRIGWIGSAAAVACIGAGIIGIPSALASAPPEGRAAVVPERPSGHGVTLVPMGSVPVEDMLGLAGFYGARYGLPIAVIDPIPIPNDVLDRSRRQLIGEDLIAYLRAAAPMAVFENQVVIGVVAEDLYVRARPDWRFAFGAIRGNVAVISTARMVAPFDLLDRALERARMRKMVTRYIGYMLYGLPESADRHSVLYDPLLSRDDLDAMGEDY